MFRKVVIRAKEMFVHDPLNMRIQFGSACYLRKNTHQTTSSIGTIKGSVYWKT